MTDKERILRLERKIDDIHQMVYELRIYHERDAAKIRLSITKILAMAGIFGGVSGSLIPELLKLIHH